MATPIPLYTGARASSIHPSFASSTTVSLSHSRLNRNRYSRILEFRGFSSVNFFPSFFPLPSPPSFFLCYTLDPRTGNWISPALSMPWKFIAIHGGWEFRGAGCSDPESTDEGVWMVSLGSFIVIVLYFPFLFLSSSGIFFSTRIKYKFFLSFKFSSSFHFIFSLRGNIS